MHLKLDFHEVLLEILAMCVLQEFLAVRIGEVHVWRSEIGVPVVMVAIFSVIGSTHSHIHTPHSPHTPHHPHTPTTHTLPTPIHSTLNHWGVSARPGSSLAAWTTYAPTPYPRPSPNPPTTVSTPHNPSQWFPPTLPTLHQTLPVLHTPPALPTLPPLMENTSPQLTQQRTRVTGKSLWTVKSETERSRWMSTWLFEHNHWQFGNLEHILK